MLVMTTILSYVFDFFFLSYAAPPIRCSRETHHQHTKLFFLVAVLVVVVVVVAARVVVVKQTRQDHQKRIDAACTDFSQNKVGFVE